MQEKLQWKQLLCSERERQSNSKRNVISKTVEFQRNPFDCDYDRIVGSSSVRRLQDKAQVFPLQENDFTRTRLTHSMEVSAIASSMGKQIGRYIEVVDPGNFKREQSEELEALLRTAGLIHDLGNPPFGHYGEDIIGDWFIQWFEKEELIKAEADLNEEELQEKVSEDLIFTVNKIKYRIMLDKMTNLGLTSAQIKEFCNYDGNVQNLRIVTKLQTMNDQYGANFTYATLASLMKYPWGIKEITEKGKYGYFESEMQIVERIYQNTGIRDHVRHPATYIMEAADDITYIGDDIEDGVKKGYILWEDEFEALCKKYDGTENKSSKSQMDLFEKLKTYNQNINTNMSKEEQLSAKVRYFRNSIQGYLINVAVKEFKKNYSSIMNGTYGIQCLIETPEETQFVTDLKKITANNCFSCREVTSLEIVGHTVISGMFDVFVPALIYNNKTKKYSKKLDSLISSNFKYIAKQRYNEKDKEEIKDEKEFSYYDKLRLIVDFVSGMTDSYALNLFRELSGIKLHYQ